MPYFNPRARVGRDLTRQPLAISTGHFNPRARGILCGVQRWISIHAPAWGATIRGHIKTENTLNFNPRARVGRDLTRLLPEHLRSIFQSTRPRGARPQPHYALLERVAISIHAPAWGAT